MKAQGLIPEMGENESSSEGIEFAENLDNLSQSSSDSSSESDSEDSDGEDFIKKKIAEKKGEFTNDDIDNM